MFRNRKISFIVGAGVAALILILQSLPPFNRVPSSFSFSDRPGLGLIHVAWILLMVSALIVVIVGVIGAFVMMKDKPVKYTNIYGIIYNITLFIPFIFCLLMLIGDAMSIFAFMSQSVPDVFAEVFILTSPPFYVVLLITLAMPIASHYRKIRKPKTDAETADNVR